MVGVASHFFCFFLMEGFLSAYVCGCDFVKSRPVGVVELCVVDGS